MAAGQIAQVKEVGKLWRMPPGEPSLVVMIAAVQHRPRVRRVRRVLVVVMLLTVLFVGGQEFALWSGAPSEAKDCAIHAVRYPGADAATNAAAAAPTFPAAVVQRGGTVNDVSCLNRTPVYGVVVPRTVADVREALAFARAHELTVSIAGTRHAMGGQAMRPGRCSSTCVG